MNEWTNELNIEYGNHKEEKNYLKEKLLFEGKN